MVEIRRLDVNDAEPAAALHRRAGALIPGYDPAAEPFAATVARYRAASAPWGAVDGGTLVGCLALEPGWLEHLYVEPASHGEGIGRMLVALAQREQDELRLVTYRANARARRLYEAAGFVVEAFGVDGSTPAKPPNVTYYWRRG